MKKVLLVDDEYMITEGLAKLISWNEFGFEIIGTASNGQEALTFVRQKIVDLVIVDINMPVKSGLSFVEEARMENFQFEVIILTGYQEFDFVVEALRQNTLNYLLKPIDEEELTCSLRIAQQKISEKSRVAQQDKLLQEAIFFQWLRGEATETEIISSYELPETFFDNAQYTVLFIHDELKQIDVPLILEEQKQPFYTYLQEEGRWLLIYIGSHNQLDSLIFRMRRYADLPYDKFAVGETVNQQNEVCLSYANAQSLKKMYEFYFNDGHTTEMYNELGAREAVPEISFVKLNQAMTIHDFVSLKKEIQVIFDQISKRNMLPEYAKHFVFLIFIDLYRIFSLKDWFYQKQAQKIIDSFSFAEMYRLVIETLAEIQKNQSHQVYSERIQQILHIIHQEYMNDINLKNISERLFLNAVYIGQLFKKEVHIGFSQYLNQYRLSEARRLLITTEEPVSTIAMNVGYSTSNHLYKNFKKLTGLSPKEFRENYRKEMAKQSIGAT